MTTPIKNSNRAGAPSAPANGHQVTIETHVCNMTPDYARDLLTENRSNRPITAKNVERLAAAIRRGEWRLSPDAIVVDCTGALLNGQHRLSAIVATGETLPLLVMTGVPPENQRIMDQGKVRHLGDFLHMEIGARNANTLSGALNFVHLFRRFGSGYMHGWARPTFDEALKLWNENPTLWEKVVGFARGPTFRSAGIPSCSPSFIAGFYYLIAEIDEDNADDFMERLAQGSSMDAGHPVLVLRNLLFSYATRGLEVGQQWRLAIFIKTWNAFMEGRTISSLRWNASERMPLLQGASN